MDPNVDSPAQLSLRCISCCHFGGPCPPVEIPSQAHMVPIGESLCHLSLAVNLLGMHNDGITQQMWLRWTSQPPVRDLIWANPHWDAHVRRLRATIPESDCG